MTSAHSGHRVDRAGAKSLLYGVGLGTGARLAVNNLAKLLPGWGSVVGAATSFASTFALGRVMNQYFAADAPIREGVTAATSDELRHSFRLAEKAAREVYAGHADVVIQSQRETKASLDALSADLAAGRITQAELDERVTELKSRPNAVQRRDKYLKCRGPRPGACFKALERRTRKKPRPRGRTLLRYRNLGQAPGASRGLATRSGEGHRVLSDHTAERPSGHLTDDSSTRTSWRARPLI